MDKTCGAGVVDKSEASAVRCTRLLALLAHDLRSPLAAVMTNLGFVEGAIPATDSDSIDALADARLSCFALEHLIANLDVLASEGSCPSLEQASLWVLVQAAVARCERLLGGAGVSLHTMQADECPDVLVAPISLGRALDNLLANSVQYSSQGRPVCIRVERHGERGVIAILDHGSIVPEPLRKTILTPEGQALSKHHPECRYGRGLGLYCAALAAGVAGAELSVGERDGRSLFLLSAPLA